MGNAGAGVDGVDGVDEWGASDAELIRRIGVERRAAAGYRELRTPAGDEMARSADLVVARLLGVIRERHELRVSAGLRRGLGSGSGSRPV